MIDTSIERKEQFKKECKVINLSFEYRSCIAFEENCLGEAKWAIITDLTEEELFNKYSEIVEIYKPFILLSIAQGEVIKKFNSNERKHRMRQCEKGDAFCFESGISEIYHSELLVFDEPDIETRIMLKQALELLKPIQKSRFIKRYILGYSIREIAREEGVYHNTVRRSLEIALDKIRKFMS